MKEAYKVPSTGHIPDQIKGQPGMSFSLTIYPKADPLVFSSNNSTLFVGDKKSLKEALLKEFDLVWSVFESRSHTQLPPEERFLGNYEERDAEISSINDYCLIPWDSQYEGTLIEVGGKEIQEGS